MHLCRGGGLCLPMNRLWERPLSFSMRGQCPIRITPACHYQVHILVEMKGRVEKEIYLRRISLITSENS